MVSCPQIPRYLAMKAEKGARHLSLAVEFDEMWSFDGAKETARWLWHALDHHTGRVLAYNSVRHYSCLCGNGFLLPPRVRTG